MQACSQLRMLPLTPTKMYTRIQRKIHPGLCPLHKAGEYSGGIIVFGICHVEENILGLVWRLFLWVLAFILYAITIWYSRSDATAAVFARIIVFAGSATRTVLTLLRCFGVKIPQRNPRFFLFAPYNLVVTVMYILNKLLEYNVTAR